MAFKKAVRRQQKLRLGIDGPSGCGKTMSALRIARGIAGPDGKVALIDTENGSASLYSDRFDFDTQSLNPPYTPKRYIELIQEAENEYDVLIIDSASHEWMGKGGILEIHAAMPGNSFNNWDKVNPMHNDFTDKILHANCHVIVTLRSKQSYSQETNEKGKTEIKKMGMAPLMRDGWEYELTAVLSQDITHVAHSTKDRTGMFDINNWFIPTEETGEMLLNWLNSGEKPLPAPAKERQLTMSEVTEKWNGEILDGDIVMINGERIKPPDAQVKKLRERQLPLPEGRSF